MKDYDYTNIFLTIIFFPFILIWILIDTILGISEKKNLERDRKIAKLSGIPVNKITAIRKSARTAQETEEYYHKMQLQYDNDYRKRHEEKEQRRKEEEKKLKENKEENLKWLKSMEALCRQIRKTDLEYIESRYENGDYSRHEYGEDYKYNSLRNAIWNIYDTNLEKTKDIHCSGLSDKQKEWESELKRQLEVANYDEIRRFDMSFIEYYIPKK